MTAVYTPVQRAALLLGPLLCAAAMWLIPEAVLPWAARAVLGAALWIALWWILEPVQVEVTALLPLVILPVSGALPIQAAAGAYGDRLVFLYLGGFVLAMAIERWGLHRRIALAMLLLAGSDARRMVLAIMAATALISMWISNSATALMMMPIGLSMARMLAADRPAEAERLSKALVLSIAYAASIGGMATLVGTPTNVVFSAAVRRSFGMEASFAQWMMVGTPVSVLLLLSGWFYLVRFGFPLPAARVAGSRAAIRARLRELGPLRPEERRVLAVFILAALAWITQGFLLKRWIPAIDDTIIALSAALLLFLLPAGEGPSRRLLDWETAVKLPWGVLLLFGGGLALAEGFSATGLAQWIGSQLSLLSGVPAWLVMLTVAVVVCYLSELASNVATASMMMPILASLALAIDVHPYALMAVATLAASGGFMLPVATPPNAVAFGTGLLHVREMARAGFAMNLLAIGWIVLAALTLLPWAWGLDLRPFPEALKAAVTRLPAP
ncbi:MAG: SLC13 family permease [Bacteroidia bacterium]|nr:SLC13 family permease [Bacteroidia bacterium]